MRLVAPNRDQKRLTGAEVQRLIKELEGRTLTRGMLQYYAEKAYVTPRPVTMRSGERGRPSSVGYSLSDVVLLRWLLRLSAEGISLKKFAGGITALRRLLPQALESPEELRFWAVNRGNIAVQIRDGERVQLTGAVGQVLLTFSGPLVTETVRRADGILDARLSRAAGGRRRSR
jgi:hypothetical protein